MIRNRPITSLPTRSHDQFCFMAKTSSLQKDNASETMSSAKKNSSATKKMKRTRKAVPRDSPPQRSSVYRGVTRHRWTGRYEAHLWDKDCWNESQNKKGRQVYLGAYDDEEAAAHAYDLAALKYWGPETILNFPPSTYEEELKGMEGQSKEEYVGALRRKSSGFSRGVSKYRGVARHHHNGRWEARIGRVFGNKYLYLGTYATQEEAATAYDVAAIEYRGLNAVTNFDLSRYMNGIRPGQNGFSSDNPNVTQQLSPLDADLLPSPNNSDQLPSFGFRTDLPDTTSSHGAGASASSTLGLLLQSSKFKKMIERTSADDCPSMSSPESEFPRRSFPDDIQTFFDCNDSGGFPEGDDGIFGELSSFAAPIFHCELDA